MGLYRYIAKTKEGKNTTDVIDVDSRDELVAKLKAQDLFIISIYPLGSKPEGGILGRLFAPRKKGKHNAVKAFDMCFFARNLSITLSAGVALLRSLDIVMVQTESAGLAKILKTASEDIHKGLSFNEAIEKYPKVFSTLWQGIIKVGETSGNLPFVLEKLANYLEMRLEFERKIKSALIYPIMVTSFSIIAMGVFFKFILPRFTEIFQQFDIRLPFITQMLINLSNFVNHNFLWIIIGMAAAIIGFIQFKKTDIGKQFLDRANLTIPLINGLTLASALERFCSTMHILLESGVPIIYTLDVVAKSSGNRVIEKDIDIIKENVKKGRSLSSELEKVDVFPPLIAEVAKVGEEAGNMPEMFDKIAQHYQKDLSTKMERLIAVFEPLVIFVLGGAIGVIVVALFMPIFQLVTLGGGGGGF